MGGIQVEEGLVVNSSASVGSWWPSRGVTCCKSSKDPGRSSPTADTAPRWSCWIAPINAAQLKSTWHVSISGLDLEAIWLLSCATDSDKHPVEAQPDPTSPPHGLISELSPVPYLFHSKQLMWLTGMLRAGTPQPWDDSAQGGHIRMIPSGWLPAPRAAHSSDPSQPTAWGTTVQGQPAAPAELLPPAAGQHPPCPVWDGSLEDTQALPDAHTGWI